MLAKVQPGKSNLPQPLQLKTGDVKNKDDDADPQAWYGV
jgi:hypothetical protein